MEYIDTHAHIFLEPFNEDIGEIIQNARKESIMEIYLPNIDSSTIGPMLKLEESYPGYCRPMIGLHPGSVDNNFEEELKIIEGLLAKREFSGIGETGTDLYWDKTFYSQQVASLLVHIELAKRYHLPIILHSRDSLDQNIEIIERHHDENLRGIFHCFTGTLNQAERIIEMGFKLGIGGIVTFKSSNLDRILAKIPLENIVLETDSPYLAPVPFRGKRNEPSFIPKIAEKLSELHAVSLAELAKTTTENAKNTFKNG